MGTGLEKFVLPLNQTPEVAAAFRVGSVHEATLVGYACVSVVAGNTPKLTKPARDAIADPTARVHVSAVTVWEVTIKAQLGRLDPGTDRMDQEIVANHFIELPISAHHALVAGNLPLPHSGPFDCMLIAQAQVENLVVVTTIRFCCL